MEKKKIVFLGLSQISDEFRITIPKEAREFINMKKKKYEAALFFAHPKTKQVAIDFYSFANDEDIIKYFNEKNEEE